MPESHIMASNIVHSFSHDSEHSVEVTQRRILDCLKIYSFRVICFGLFLFFLIQISLQYSKHTMKTDYLEMDAETEVIPSLSVCFKRTKCYSDEEWKNDFGHGPIGMFEIRKFVKSFEILDPSRENFIMEGYSIDLTAAVTPFDMMYGNDQLRCLNVDVGSNWTTKFKVGILFGGLDVACGDSKWNGRILFVSPRGTLPTSEDFRPRKITATNSKIHVDLIYEIIKYQKLAEPFASDCYDYARNGTVTQRRCLEMCLIENHYKSARDHPVTFPKTDLFRKFGNFMSYDLFDTSECSHCRKQDCSLEFIHRAYGDYSKSVSGKNTSATFFDIKFRDKVKVYRLVPTITTSVYLIYILSALASTANLELINIISIIPYFMSSVLGYIWSSKIQTFKSVFKTMKLLIIVTCICGFLWQAYDIVIVYANRETFTEISQREATSTPRPRVALCFENADIMKPSCPISKESLTRFAVPPGNISARDLNKYLYDAWELIEEIRYTTSRTMKIFRNENLKNFMISNMTVYLKQNFKCFEFNVGGVFAGSRPEAWFAFKTFSNTTLPDDNQQLRIQVGSRYSRKDNVFRLSDESTRVFSPKVNKITSLPTPYPSHCRDYEADVWGDGSTECLMKCKYQYFATKFGQVPHTFPVMVNSTVRFQLEDPVVPECSDRCSSPPCLRYENGVLRQILSDNKKEVSFHSNTRLMFITMVPKINILDVVFLVHQVFASWLGLHMFVVIFVLKRLKVCQTCQRIS